MVNTLLQCIRALLCLCILAISAPVEGSEEVHIIFPSDKSVISVSKITVIGNISSGDGFSLDVENSSGKKAYQLEKGVRFFSHKVDLADGKNTLRILKGSDIFDAVEVIFSESSDDSSIPEDYIPYYLHSENDLSDECSLCHPGKEDDLNRFKNVDQKTTCITADCHTGLDKSKFLHGPLTKEGSCVKCHNPHGSENKDFTTHFSGSLCFDCHIDAARMTSNAKYVHFPVKKRECTACHDPHGSNLEFHLKRDTVVGLCSGCHGDDKTSHEVLHTPLKAGDCIACHTPHVSDHKGLLLESGKELCFKCHKVRKEEFNSKYIHEPVAKNCTICHDPHGSAAIYHLRSEKDKDGVYIKKEQPIKELCLSCHDKLDPEVVDQLKKGDIKHEPVEEGKCTVCHTPHSTNHAKQLKLPLTEICFSCHEKMQDFITSSIYKHGPIKKDGCADCHLPHGSENTKLLVSPYSEKFTDSFSMEKYALCFNCHAPELVLDKKTRLTGFRNGSSNLHFLHVNRKKKSRSCKACHEVHASDQDKHIRDKVQFERRFTFDIKFNKTETGGECLLSCHKPKKYDR